MDESIYREELLDHFRHPHNAGKPKSYSHSHQEVNSHCGDETRVFLDVHDGKITDIHHLSKGCAVSVASASILSDELRGKSAKEVISLTASDLLGILKLKLSPTRAACALLPLEAIKKALI